MLTLKLNEVFILQNVLRYLLGFITEDELKELNLKSSHGKANWEGVLTPLLNKIETISIDITTT